MIKHNAPLNLGLSFLAALPLYTQEPPARSVAGDTGRISPFAARDAEAALEPSRHSCLSFSDMLGMMMICTWDDSPSGPR